MRPMPVLAMVICSLAAAPAPSVPDDWVPLKVEPPKGRLPHDVVRLEIQGSRPRPPLMVPPGTALLSRGKPVTSSHPEPIAGELKQVTDGHKSYEGLPGDWIWLNAGLQWVQVDLQKPSALHAIIIWRPFWPPRAYNDVIIQVSNDPQFRENVVTLFNNNADGSAGHGKGTDQRYIEHFEGKLIEPKGVTARYIRIYSNGSTQDEYNDYSEVEVFGLPD